MNNLEKIMADGFDRIDEAMQDVFYKYDPLPCEKRIVFMNNIKLVHNADLIDTVENYSCPNVARVRIKFKNGYQMSVISGLGHMFDSGLFEIAVFDRQGKMTNEPLGVADDVLGNLTVDQVNGWIELIGRIPAVKESLITKTGETI